ncbi:Transcription initiation factor TFIID subunit 12 [Blastocladiella emersonii ATCC 22665]|nr:Transcription initiation factor TFIID subunit 12 [Blastocladiella emersonii ATCC 22665]
MSAPPPPQQQQQPAQQPQPQGAASTSWTVQHTITIMDQRIRLEDVLDSIRRDLAVTPPEHAAQLRDREAKAVMSLEKLAISFPKIAEIPRGHLQTMRNGIAQRVEAAAAQQAAAQAAAAAQATAQGQQAQAQGQQGGPPPPTSVADMHVTSVPALPQPIVPPVSLSSNNPISIILAPGPPDAAAAAAAASSSIHPAAPSFVTSAPGVMASSPAVTPAPSDGPAAGGKAPVGKGKGPAVPPPAKTPAAAGTAGPKPQPSTATPDPSKTATSGNTPAAATPTPAPGGGAGGAGPTKRPIPPGRTNSTASRGPGAAAAPATSQPPPAPPTKQAPAASTVPSQGVSRSATLPKDTSLGLGLGSGGPPAGGFGGPSSTNPAVVAGAADAHQVLGKRRLAELVAQMDPTLRVDGDVHEMLMEMADEFIESTTRFACDLAKHRKGNTLEVRDLQLYLESHYRIRVPGFFAGAATESMELNVAKRRPANAFGHQSRLAAVKKAKFDENNRREKSREKAKDKDAAGN